MRALLVICAVVVLAFAVGVGCKKKEVAPTAVTVSEGPTPATAKAVVTAGDAANGLKLWSDASLGTNGKSCETCHPDGGKKGMTGEAKTDPLVGVAKEYPGKFPMMPDMGDMTLAQVTNACIEGPMAGKALAEDNQQLKDLVAYQESL